MRTIVPTWYASVQPAIPNDAMTHVHISPELVYGGVNDIIMVYVITSKYANLSTTTTIKTIMRGSDNLVQNQ